jgi:phage terminase large subunit GpA-like protein
MDAINDPAIETVVVMSSAQVGKTEIINNIVGYYIHQDPAPMLVVQPTEKMAEVSVAMKKEGEKGKSVV